ncbi:chorismate mutase [Candidatus Methanoperedens nitroreducens]|uniref:Chorismate mutase n=1 Tax=Candidatus Methanoperedens nitratireducens TaxID=1392998 RepID=A0A062UTY2_9EURY|nr:chorismate mutase [Candidatus Methanoperedens nitroreducens]KCZ70486.1 chorismate mutase [Candidatus Methanoperedens nitroreducens]MDJ1420924.1 chorismate mutase [Candidatus Methanoperedens sp.]
MQLKEVRGKIQKIDEELLCLIEKRTNLAKEVLDAKRAEGKTINDVEQNKVVLDRVTNAATERGLDGEQVKKIFEILINMNIERQHELSGEGNLP